MNDLTVTAKTEAGIAALNKHIADVFHLRRDQKLMFRTLGYTHEKISDDPLAVKLTVKNSRLRHLINPQHLIWIIQEALSPAEKDKDYSIEVK